MHLALTFFSFQLVIFRTIHFVFISCLFPFFLPFSLIMFTTKKKKEPAPTHQESGISKDDKMDDMHACCCVQDPSTSFSTGRWFPHAVAVQQFAAVNSCFASFLHQRLPLHVRSSLWFMLVLKKKIAQEIFSPQHEIYVILSWIYPITADIKLHTSLLCIIHPLKHEMCL